MTVVVSKKVHKSAVKRNKIRRRVVEIYRQNWLDKVKLPCDLVIFVHNDKVLKKSPLQLTQDIGNLLDKADLL